MESYLANLAVLILVMLPLFPYLRRMSEKRSAAAASAEKGKLFSGGPQAQHPHIDASKCIGCGTCADACPEGDVLAVVAGRAAIVNGYKCIGHGLCEEACPVGAITMVMSRPSIGADLPLLTPEYETNIPGMFVAGELSGLALIKNAVNQGRDCIDVIAERLQQLNGSRVQPGVVDVCIVGAGPAGISASLRAIERKLSYVTLEQDEIGGTVAKYPRQKLVMTSPVEFPLHGPFRKLQISKESLLAFWEKIFQRADLKVRTSEKVEEIGKQDGEPFRIQTSRSRHAAHFVVLAVGRRGTPRKLGIPGEDSPKVMYSLIEAEAYTGSDILVVGGGDSAVEAALGLAHQKGNRVTLSYRGSQFTRIKERNARRIEALRSSGKVKILFNSRPAEIRDASVILESHGETTELPNRYVWIFAGGTPPSEFLGKLGIRMGECDLTHEAAKEARLPSGEGHLQRAH